MKRGGKEKEGEKNIWRIKTEEKEENIWKREIFL